MRGSSLYKVVVGAKTTIASDHSCLRSIPVKAMMSLTPQVRLLMAKLQISFHTWQKSSCIPKKEEKTSILEHFCCCFH